jgi:methoxymalonate biosynthesis protein
VSEREGSQRERRASRAARPAPAPASPPEEQASTVLVKAVVWDLDGTLWPGVALESEVAPEPYQEVVSILDTLAARGILLSLASRNPTSIGELVEGAPALTGRFVAPQFGWGRKAEALRRIADELEIGLDTVAFVDDDPFERADVERSLPEVVVLAPEELRDALSWPEFDPGPVTAAGRSRVDSYRRRARRRAARAEFAGSEEDFLRSCELRATVREARSEDQDRLVELARRTTQYNSTGVPYQPGELTAVIELSDRFGDDGLVGLASVAAPDGPEWTIELVAVSCRAGGRGALPILVTGVARRARAAGATRLSVWCRLTDRNVPVRLGLRQAGFAATSRTGGTATFSRDLADAPAYPEWVAVDDRLSPRPGVPA